MRRFPSARRLSGDVRSIEHRRKATRQWVFAYEIRSENDL
jgi:hypothetical protein